MAFVGIVLLFLLTIIASVVGDLKLQPNEETEDCTAGGKAKYVDFSKLVVLPYNDTLFFLNGKSTSNVHRRQ
jgi:hypothetical protein